MQPLRDQQKLSKFLLYCTLTAVEKGQVCPPFINTIIWGDSPVALAKLKWEERAIKRTPEGEWVHSLFVKVYIFRRFCPYSTVSFYAPWPSQHTKLMLLYTPQRLTQKVHPYRTRAWCLTTLCLQKHLSVESVAMYVMWQTENCHRQSFSKVWKYNCYITELLGVTRSFLQRIKPSSWLHAVSDCEYKQESAKLPILCTVSLSGRGTRFVHQHCFPLN